MVFWSHILHLMGANCLKKKILNFFLNMGNIKSNIFTPQKLTSMS